MDTINSLVIETHNLSKAYKGVQALQDLNLTVKEHSIFGFLGPNGAGKSTTIKLLSVRSAQRGPGYRLWA